MLDGRRLRRWASLDPLIPVGEGEPAGAISFRAFFPRFFHPDTVARRPDPDEIAPVLRGEGREEVTSGDASFNRCATGASAIGTRVRV